MIPIRENRCYCFTFETTDTVDVFTKPMYKQLIVHSLNHFIDSKGLLVYGWCLMSNKLYLICQAQARVSLKALRKDFAIFTCQKIVEAIKEEYSLRNIWLLKHFTTASLFDEAITESCWGDIKTMAEIDMNMPQSMAEQLELIHSVPIKERIVQYPADYLYSSARDYAGMPGLVKITKPAAVELELCEIESYKRGFRTNYL